MFARVQIRLISIYPVISFRLDLLRNETYFSEKTRGVTGTEKVGGGTYKFIEVKCGVEGM